MHCKHFLTQAVWREKYSVTPTVNEGLQIFTIICVSPCILTNVYSSPHNYQTMCAHVVLHVISSFINTGHTLKNINNLNIFLTSTSQMMFSLQMYAGFDCWIAQIACHSSIRTITLINKCNYMDVCQQKLQSINWFIDGCYKLSVIAGWHNSAVKTPCPGPKQMSQH